MVLRTGTVDDAAAAAALHAGQISEGFLSLLGPSFLRRLYRRIARTPDSFLLIVEDGTDTVGFLAGSTDVSGLYRSFVLRDGIRRGLRQCRSASSLLAPGDGDTSPRRKRRCRRGGTAGRCRRSGGARMWCRNPPGERIPQGDGPTAAGRGARCRGRRQRDCDRPVRSSRIRKSGEIRVAPGHRVPSDAVARAAGDPAGVSTAVLVAVASAVITAVAVPGCIVIAHRFGVIDRPGPLKPHAAPVPYLGESPSLPALWSVCRSVGRSFWSHWPRPWP